MKIMKKHHLDKNRVSKTWKLLGLIFPLFGSFAMADLYVSPAGSDTNPGSLDKPLASLARARDLAQADAGKKAVTVHVADGMYYLPETLIFTPKDSGSAEHPIV